MKSFKDLAINTKLTLLVLLAGGVALLMSCIAFVVNDVRMIRPSTVSQMSTLTAGAWLQQHGGPEFRRCRHGGRIADVAQTAAGRGAGMHLRRPGKVFAAYYRGRTAADAAARAPTAGLSSSRPMATSTSLATIDFNGQRIGTIYVHASMRELHDQMWRYVNIAAVVMAVSLAASLLLSSRLQRVISVPILKLAEAAERISVERDYSIRVTKFANDELGVLYDQFNAMLDEIQRGEAAIQRAQDELELQIQQRTAQLSRPTRTSAGKSPNASGPSRNWPPPTSSFWPRPGVPEWPKSPPECSITSEMSSIASMFPRPWPPTEFDNPKSRSWFAP